jgi:hypothetical protein
MGFEYKKEMVLPLIITLINLYAFFLRIILFRKQSSFRHYKRPFSAFNNEDRVFKLMNRSMLGRVPVRQSKRTRPYSYDVRQPYSTLSTHPSVRVFLSDLQKGVVLARMEFDRSIDIGSVSFIYGEIIKVVLIHLVPSINDLAKMTVVVSVKSSTAG